VVESGRKPERIRTTAWSAGYLPFSSSGRSSHVSGGRRFRDANSCRGSLGVLGHRRRRHTRVVFSTSAPSMRTTSRTSRSPSTRLVAPVAPSRSGLARRHDGRRPRANAPATALVCPQDRPRERIVVTSSLLLTKAPRHPVPLPLLIVSCLGFFFFFYKMYSQ